MKVKIKATIVFTWEEDAKDWEDEDHPPKTEKELLDLVQRYVEEEDSSYILDMEPDSIDIELEKEEGKKGGREEVK